jgi:hypothetical protein
VGNYQGIGEVTQQGQHISKVKYSVQPTPIEGEIEVEKGEKNLSGPYLARDRLTLHMEGGLVLDFRIAQVSDQVNGKYYITGIGDFRRSS